MLGGCLIDILNINILISHLTSHYSNTHALCLLRILFLLFFVFLT